MKLGRKSNGVDRGGNGGEQWGLDLIKIHYMHV